MGGPVVDKRYFILFITFSAYIRGLYPKQFTVTMEQSNRGLRALHTSMDTTCKWPLPATIIKFADSTVVVDPDLISNNDKKAYLDQIKHLKDQWEMVSSLMSGQLDKRADNGL